MRYFLPAGVIALCFIAVTTGAKDVHGNLHGISLDVDTDDEGAIVNIETDRCTAIAVGPKAGVEGTMTTHTMDCFNCDFRINKVPAMDWEEGAKRPLHIYKADYPAQIDSTRGNTWAPENLEGSKDQIKAWKENVVITGHIPQVRHTYALIEGGYGIMNEHQVAIGESTCASKLWAKPTTAGGKAMIEVAEMSKIGLERGKTAREVIQIMGDLATTYGFYAADWGGGDMSKGEGGEGLTVVDKTEAWVFHVTSDDTGTSAIWAAQRVPDHHISVIANQFVIREIDEDDTKNFMFSDNLFKVAKRTGFWDPKENPKMDFLKTFGPARRHPPYATRRMWRVFQLAAPSVSLPPDTDGFQDDYPFSVKVDKPLTVEDVIAIQRDHYEGTQFDLTKGLAAGPYGDPNRFDVTPVDGLTLMQMTNGGFERAISLFRTSYSFVAHPRTWMPDELAMMWFGQYAPSSCSYTPLYVSADELPKPFTTGSLFKYDDSVAYWNFLAAGNYAARFYKYAMQAVFDLQHSLHKQMLANQAAFEGQMIGKLAASEFIPKGLPGATSASELAAQFTKFSKEQADLVVTSWKDLLPTLITTYHDGMIALDVTSRDIVFKKLFYPYWWLNATGYFDTKPNTGPDVIAFQPGPDSSSDSGSSSSTVRFVGMMLLTGVASSVLTIVAYTAMMRKLHGGNPARYQYEPIGINL